MITIDLPPDLETQLGHIATEQGKSKEAYLRDVIAEYLQDLLDFQEAERRMAKFNPDTATTLEDMIARHGLED